MLNQPQPVDISAGISIAYQTILNDALFQINLLSNIAASDSRQNKYNIRDKEPAKKVLKQRQLINQVLAPTSNELLATNTFSALTQWIDKEKDLQDLLFNTVRREKEAVMVLQSTQAQISQEHKSTQKVVLEKESVIQQLKDAIHEIRYLSTSETTFLKNEHSAKQSYNQATRDHALKSLQTQSLALTSSLTSEHEINASLLLFLTRQKESLEALVTTWSIKYETDLDQKLEELKVARFTSAEGYEKMLVGFERMERFIEEYRVGREKTLEEMRVKFRRIVAAKRIQRWFRSLRKVKAPVSGGKSKKKGKGKK